MVPQNPMSDHGAGVVTYAKSVFSRPAVVTRLTGRPRCGGTAGPCWHGPGPWGLGRPVGVAAQAIIDRLKYRDCTLVSLCPPRPRERASARWGRIARLSCRRGSVGGLRLSWQGAVVQVVQYAHATTAIASPCAVVPLRQDAPARPHEPKMAGDQSQYDSP